MKAGRQRLILELLERQAIATQEELAAALKSRGYPVTQATVSRDIKELGLVKVPAAGGGYRYAAPPEPPPGNVLERLRRLFRDSVASLDFSENIILVRTLPGTAHAVASCLDQWDCKEIIGTVAGDDTILVVVKPRDAVPAVLAELERLLE